MAPHDMTDLYRHLVPKNRNILIVAVILVYIFIVLFVAISPYALFFDF